MVFFRICSDLLLVSRKMDDEKKVRGLKTRQEVTYRFSSCATVVRVWLVARGWMAGRHHMAWSEMFAECPFHGGWNISESCVVDL